MTTPAQYRRQKANNEALQAHNGHLLVARTERLSNAFALALTVLFKSMSHCMQACSHDGKADAVSHFVVSRKLSSLPPCPMSVRLPGRAHSLPVRWGFWR